MIAEHSRLGSMLGSRLADAVRSRFMRASRCSQREYVSLCFASGPWSGQRSQPDLVRSLQACYNYHTAKMHEIFHMSHEADQCPAITAHIPPDARRPTPLTPTRSLCVLVLRPWRLCLGSHACCPRGAMGPDPSRRNLECWLSFELEIGHVGCIGGRPARQSGIHL